MQSQAILEREGTRNSAARSYFGDSIRRLFGRVFSFPVLPAAGLVVVTVVTIVEKRFNDPDVWWHLRLGQIIATTHNIPSTDLFSFTGFGSPSLSHEWLGELSIYWAYAVGGYTGLLAWLAVLGSLIFILVYVLCWSHTKNVVVSFAGAMIAWFFGVIGLTIRPLILGHLFLVSELLILQLARTKDRRWLWTLPPLFVLWVNCHASYYFGITVLLVCWVCSHINGRWGLIVSEASDSKFRNQLGLALITSTIALCVNPIGGQLLLFPLRAMSGAGFEHSSEFAIQEFLPPTMNDPRAIMMLVVLGGILFLSLVRGRELRIQELLLVFMAFVLASRHIRMMFLLGIMVSPVLARMLNGKAGTERNKEDRPLLNAAFICAALALVFWVFPNSAAIQQQIRKGTWTPIAAVEYIKSAGLSGPMLNAYEFGGFLIWALPEEPTFIDGRGAAPRLLLEYDSWTKLADDPRVLLDKYQIRFCILPKSAAMVQVLPYLPGWHKVYADEVAVVFAR